MDRALNKWEQDYYPETGHQEQPAREKEWELLPPETAGSGPPPDDHGIGWDVYQAGIVLLLCFAFAVTSVSLISFIFPGMSMAATTIWASLLQGLAFILAPYYVAKTYHPREGWAALGLPGSPGLSSVFRGLMWGFGLYLMAFVVNILVVSVFFEQVESQAILSLLVEAESFWTKAGLIFCIVVVAPISEEIFFRGFLYQALRKRWGIKMGAFSSGLAFAIVHFDWVVLISFTLLGIGFALLYEKTRSLISCIMAHGIFNAISVALLFFTLHMQNAL